MRHLFGPVPSRRLGFSLGIDIVPAKTCTLNCIYCQLGPTPEVTLERKPYAPAETIVAEVAGLLKDKPRIDFFTFSGSGEPTLNSELGAMIRGVKKIADIPVAVITNGSLLHLKEVRDDLSAADVVLPSLDAVSEEAFRAVNRPHPGLSARLALEGLAEFSRGYKGRIWLEIMLVRGVNDSPAELEKIRKAVEPLKLDKIQLNTVVRPPAEEGVLPLTRREMEAAAAVIDLGCEIIAEFGGRIPASFQADQERILETLKRRPLTLDDLVAVTGVNPNEIKKVLARLLESGAVKRQMIAGKEFYSAPKG